MGLRLQTSFELPALGSRVALAIVHSLGTSDNANDRLKSSTIISGIAKNVSLNISLDNISIHDDLLILVSLHNFNHFVKICFHLIKNDLSFITIKIPRRVKSLC